jgi:hypothetical protein
MPAVTFCPGIIGNFPFMAEHLRDKKGVRVVNYPLMRPFRAAHT